MAEDNDMRSPSLQLQSSQRDHVLPKGSGKNPPVSPWLLAGHSPAFLGLEREALEDRRLLGQMPKLVYYPARAAARVSSERGVVQRAERRLHHQQLHHQKETLSLEKLSLVQRSLSKPARALTWKGL